MSPHVAKRPKVLVFDDYSRMSRHVALEISQVIKSKRKSDDSGNVTVLGLATGSSPLGIYRELVKMYRHGEIDFSNCVFFNLDEYYGLSKEDLQSYHRFMRENLFDYLDVNENQINIPDGTVENDRIRSFCEEYEAKIRGYGGIDLQILGIGRDGHIGFNEPRSSVDSRTRLVELAETTRRDASIDFFGLRNVPTKALTMGIATILDAKQIVLMASGEHKAQIVRRALEGAPTQEVPASFLQYHDAVAVLADTSAASLLIEYSAPWLVNYNIDWRRERMLSRSAVIWLARRRNKALFELTDEDFRRNSLGSLLLSLGQSIGTDMLIELESKVNLLKKLFDQKENEGRKKVVIFSPHPDDDVICMGATMKKMVDSGNEVRVAYMVSGANAVKDLDVLNYLVLGNEEVRKLVSEYATLNGRTYSQAIDIIVQLIYSKAKGMTDDHIVRKIKGEIRRQEAMRASSRAGASAYFLNLPFYEEYGSARKAPISEEDVSIVRRFLLDALPDAIFLAGDSTDPNGTHSMCIDAFHEAFRSLSEHAKTDEQKKYVTRFKTEGKQGSVSFPMMLHYRGAWQEFSIEEVDAVEVFDERIMGEKIKMILEHVSQLDPLFPGPDDDRQFWERARDRNIEFLDSSKRLGLKMGGLGAEVYKISHHDGT